MQRSITNELYSEIMPLSSVELGRESTAAQAKEVLQENDQDDLWYDDGSDEESVDKTSKTSDMDREWQKRRNQFHTIGYRDGLIAGKEASAQEGFNVGFKDSVVTGYNWGRARGVTSALACLPVGLKETLIETEETRNAFQSLHESVQSVSTTDALKLFYKDQKRKSENQKENAKSEDPNHQNAEANVLENYQRQLESLLNKSPLLQGNLK